jgi:hypothetical protein
MGGPHIVHGRDGALVNGHVWLKRGKGGHYAWPPFVLIRCNYCYISLTPSTKALSLRLRLG